MQNYKMGKELENKLKLKEEIEFSIKILNEKIQNTNSNFIQMKL